MRGDDGEVSSFVAEEYCGQSCEGGECCPGIKKGDLKNFHRRLNILDGRTQQKEMRAGQEGGVPRVLIGNRQWRAGRCRQIWQDGGRLPSCRRWL